MTQNEKHPRDKFLDELNNCHLKFDYNCLKFIAIHIHCDIIGSNFQFQ